MTAQTYTHRDLAKELGVSETTIKSYRAKFPTFLPVAREGKPVRLHPESLAVCRRIRDLFADGLSILQAIKVLRAEFKEYPQNRRLSVAQSRRGGFASVPLDARAPSGGDSALVERIEALTKSQTQARERMEKLEAEVRNLATLEAASKALVAELVAELRAARVMAPPAPLNLKTVAESVPPPAPGPLPGQPADQAMEPATDPQAPTVLTAHKIVSVHGEAGSVASYALAREPEPTPLFPEPESPPPAFLALPAVILSDRGDFLGLPGGQSVSRLVEVLSPEGAAVAWLKEGPDAWTCAIPLGRAQNREILFERTTTPRGNLVGHIRRMRINESEATQVQLQEIFRQLRDQMA
ncbi:MAG: MerR family transcriptional regulator [Humidesulfovibrio sp.]|nr:MerR family transcriptional regulator [Humidesulfovibrio sp.]